MDKLLPGSIDKEHIRVLEQIVDERLAGIPLEKLLIYIIETCDPQALPYLAKQFNVLGNRGWRWADTEQKKRDLLKRAIKMQRKEGTEFAVKESLKVIGINTAQILHPIPGNTYNGQWSFNGSITYGGAYHWASFKVLVDADELSTLPSDTLQIAVELINEWKNVRSKLVAVEAAIDIEDSVDVTDELMFEGDLNIVDQVGPYTYDGSIDYNGEENYDQTYDEFVLNLPGDFIVEFTPNTTTLFGMFLFFDGTVDYDLVWGDTVVSGQATDELIIEDYEFITTASANRLTIRISDSSKFISARINSPDAISLRIASQMNSLNGINLQSSALSQFLPGSFTAPALVGIAMQANQLSSAQVNSILAWAVANGAADGTLSLGGQTPPAPPTGQGITDKATLISNGWIVTTD